jgi:hypothetical protein
VVGAVLHHGLKCKAFLIIFVVVGSADPTAFVVQQVMGGHFAYVLLNFLPCTNPAIGQGVNQILHCLAAKMDGKQIKSL